MNNQTLRNKIEQLFGLPAMKMPWTLYLAQLNEAGKLTARSIMDIMTIVLTVIEEQEEKIKDLELLSQQPTQTVSNEPETIKIYKLEPKIEVEVADVNKTATENQTQEAKDNPERVVENRNGLKPEVKPQEPKI